MPGDEPAPEVRAAMARLLKATEAYTRAFGVWTAEPQRQEELLEAERRLEDAQREAIAVHPKRPGSQQP